MVKLLKPITTWYRLWKQVGDPVLAYRLLPKTATPRVDARAERSGDGFRFAKYDKNVNRRQIRLFEGDGELLSTFVKAQGLRFESDRTGRDVVCATCNGRPVRLLARDSGSLKVIREVYIDRLYDFHGRGRYVVMDVGMNVGAASLFFASHPNVEKVVGYEPFSGTRTVASENLSLNPELAEKIEIRPYGLGVSDTTIEVPEPSAGYLGGTTTDFMMEASGEADARTRKTSVELRDILPEMERIIEQHRGCSLLLKMDCEGAEYDLLATMEASGRLADVDTLMLEYHLKGKESLTESLVGAGFTTLSPNSGMPGTCDMLYAFKRP